MIELTQEIVRELLDYDPETGVLRWKERGLHWFSTDGKKTQTHLMNQWNSRLAGKEAFTSTSNNGYKVGAVKDRKFLAHRIIWLWVYGWVPEEVDHKNGDKTDNRIVNLREVTRAINQRNKRKLSNNTSGYCGVTQDKRDGKWTATFVVDGLKYSCGYWETPEQANEALMKKRAEFDFSERHGL